MMADQLSQGESSADSHVSGVVHNIVYVSWEEDESCVENHGHQSDENTEYEMKEFVD